jgi:hypothetical protein
MLIRSLFIIIIQIYTNLFSAKSSSHDTVVKAEPIVQAAKVEADKL